MTYFKSLPWDDVTRGKWVTILRGPQVPTQTNPFGGTDGAIIEDKSQNGRVFRVSGVSLPFVALLPLRPPKTAAPTPQPHPLELMGLSVPPEMVAQMQQLRPMVFVVDLREVVLIELQPQYVSAVRKAIDGSDFAHDGNESHQCANCANNDGCDKQRGLLDE